MKYLLYTIYQKLAKIGFWNQGHWAKFKGHSDLIFGLQVDIHPRSYNCHIIFSWTQTWPNLPTLFIYICQGHWAKVKCHSDLFFGLQVDISPRIYNCHIIFSCTNKWTNVPSLLINNCQGHWAKVKGHSDLKVFFSETTHYGN